MRTMIEMTKEKLMKYKDMIEIYNGFEIRRDLYAPVLLEGSVESYEYPLFEASQGVQGSFRKLEID